MIYQENKNESMETTKTISEADIQKFLKENGPTSLNELAEHFGEAVKVIRVNKGFRDFIWKLLHKDSGIGLDEEWRLVTTKNNKDHSHLLQQWSLNEINHDAVKEKNDRD